MASEGIIRGSGSATSRLVAGIEKLGDRLTPRSVKDKKQKRMEHDAKLEAVMSSETSFYRTKNNEYNIKETNFSIGMENFKNYANKHSAQVGNEQNPEIAKLVVSWYKYCADSYSEMKESYNACVAQCKEHNVLCDGLLGLEEALQTSLQKESSSALYSKMKVNSSIAEMSGKMSEYDSLLSEGLDIYQNCVKIQIQEKVDENISIKISPKTNDGTVLDYKQIERDSIKTAETTIARQSQFAELGRGAISKIAEGIAENGIGTTAKEVYGSWKSAREAKRQQANVEITQISPTTQQSVNEAEIQQVENSVPPLAKDTIQGAEVQRAAAEAERRAEIERQRAAAEAERRAEIERQRAAAEAERRAEVERQRAAAEAERIAEIENQRGTMQNVSEALTEQDVFDYAEHFANISAEEDERDPRGENAGKITGLFYKIGGAIEGDVKSKQDIIRRSEIYQGFTSAPDKEAFVRKIMKNGFSRVCAVDMMSGYGTFRVGDDFVRFSKEDKNQFRELVFKVLQNQTKQKGYNPAAEVPLKDEVVFEEASVTPQIPAPSENANLLRSYNDYFSAYAREYAHFYRDEAGNRIKKHNGTELQRQKKLISNMKKLTQMQKRVKPDNEPDMSDDVLMSRVSVNMSNQDIEELIQDESAVVKLFEIAAKDEYIPDGEKRPIRLSTNQKLALSTILLQVSEKKVNREISLEEAQERTRAIQESAKAALASGQKDLGSGE